MNKKLQVFISSTYTDMIDERQAAVEAILSAGHIPAGMELFSAGNESQLEVIQRWIDESDVYLLILGGRYGSIEPKTGKSYTHLEYEYAVSKGIPVFAVVIDEKAMFKKAGKQGKEVIETDNPEKFSAFKNLVLSKMSKFFEDEKDIQLAIHTTLSDFSKRYKLSGWISGKEFGKVDELISQNSILMKENEKLKKELEKVKKQTKSKVDTEMYYEQIRNALLKMELTLKIKSKEPVTVSVYQFFIISKDDFATGITNQFGSSEETVFLFYSLSPKLMMYGLVETQKVSGVVYERIRTTKEGFAFLRYCEANPLKNKK